MIKRTRKNLIEDLKIIKDNHKTIKEFAKDKYVDENGIANIHVYVNKENIYNSYSNPSDPELSDELISYIENEAYYIPFEYKLKLVFHFEEGLSDNKIKEKIKEYYFKKMADKEDDLKRNSWISIILLIIGVVLLSTHFVLKIFPQTADLFNEIISVAASFSIWEAIDYFLINRSAIKIEYLNIAQLILADVEVKEDK